MYKSFELWFKRMQQKVVKHYITLLPRLSYIYRLIFFNESCRSRTYSIFCNYCKETILNFIKRSLMNAIDASFFPAKILKRCLNFFRRQAGREWKSKISTKILYRAWVYNPREKKNKKNKKKNYGIKTRDARFLNSPFYIFQTKIANFASIDVKIL